jgi:hypothetical protein
VLIFLTGPVVCVRICLTELFVLTALFLFFKAAVVASYDQSCDDQASPDDCPFGILTNCILYAGMSLLTEYGVLEHSY